ncbi:hypothetical protein [Sinorhizobium fredii]|uniref:Uncharacterized protein n=1 Tax=Rhizobium fredii TaxID=380 RepID=A0A2A6LX60_RHIFR|nr:hypothetical protein [Sinorhizobium fredii]KSV85690.1 hypothetical protein N181_22995 [Sinorhizobium fredii USDA 205]MQW98730.1 hypothetical protein [Sinorhizobium fredii]MQX11078.1 hypothetical protein [Sinorhizobium fredii]PDT46917.1 hypothetical protein CO661_14585 [Sinorhizobium fredii]UTY49966.1 hypothetical protein EPK84_26010 [Sinorhizobium fredii]
MNKPFDLYVFIVLVAAYFVFRLSLTLPRSDQRETGSDEKAAFAPEAKFTRHAAFRQANDDCQPRRSAEASRMTASLARIRAAPSFRVHRKPTQTEHAEALGMVAVMQQRRPRLANAQRTGRGNEWVSENAQ